MTGNLFSPSFREANPQAVKDKVAMGMKMGEDGMINFYKAMIGRDDNIAVVKYAPFPIQWIMGVDDLIINYEKSLKECHQSYINFVTLFSHCGHMSIIEKPAMLIADLKQFGGYCNNHHPNA